MKPTDYIQQIGVNLDSLFSCVERESKGQWDNASIAEKLGITESHLRNLRAGRARPTLELVEKMCEIFGFRAKEIYPEFTDVVSQAEADGASEFWTQQANELLDPFKIKSMVMTADWTDPKALLQSQGVISILPTPYGILIGSPVGIPIELATKFFGILGDDAVIDAALGYYYSISSGMHCFALGTAEGVDAWCKQINDVLDSKKLTPRDRWFYGLDTGISSMTIFCTMTDREMPLNWKPNTPRDAGDFGRCFRLIRHFPMWESRLGEVAEKYPEWRPILLRWKEMCELYAAGEGQKVSVILGECAEKGQSS